MITKTDAIVTDIFWERIFMYIRVKIEGQEITDPQFYLVNEKGQADAHFELIESKNNEFTIRINVSNNGQCRCVANGMYSIFVCDCTSPVCQCNTSTRVVESIDDFSRNFLYDHRNNEYSVTFSVEDNNDDLILNIYMHSTGDSNQIRKPDKKEAVRIIYNFFSLFGKKKKSILFLTEQSEELKSNLKAVYDRMLERKIDEQYSINISARSSTDRSKSILSWIRMIRLVAKSQVIFIDDHVPMFDCVKIKNSRIIQLWHAGAGFKSSGYSRWGHDGCPGPVSCHRQYEFGIAGSRAIAPFFSEVWGINDEQVLPTGMPRMDEFLNPEHRMAVQSEILEKYPICKGKKVILFAPTYRGRNKNDAFYPYELIDFDKLYKVCGDEYIVMFKMHPWVHDSVPIDRKYSDKFIDVGNYPEINDLFYITDLLITDYSSNIYEFSLMKKPMLFFAFDKVQYSFSRGFHRDYEKAAPGKVCYNFNDVIESIANGDFEEEKVLDYISKHFDNIDSNSSDRVIEWIIEDKIPASIKDLLDNRKNDIKIMKDIDFKYKMKFMDE